MSIRIITESVVFIRYLGVVPKLSYPFGKSPSLVYLKMNFGLIW